MKQFYIGKRSVDLPETWDEIPTRHLEGLVRLTRQAMPLSSARLRYVLYLMDVYVSGRVDADHYEFCRVLRRGVLSSTDFQVLSHSVDFLFCKESSGDGYFVDSRLTRCPYPLLRHRLRLFRSPGDALERLSYEQFVYCLFYQQLMETEPSALYDLLACLWHTGAVWTLSRLERDSRLLRSLSSVRQTVMLWYWMGCLSFLRQKFPRIFAPVGTGKATTPGELYDSQLRIIDALADGDMTRKEAVRKGDLYDALYSMDEAIRKNEELEKHLHR